MTALSARTPRAALRRSRRLAPVPAIVVLALLLVAGVAVAALLELTTYATALLLPPVLLAGIRFRGVGGVLTGLAAGAIGGPAASALGATTTTTIATQIATTVTLVLVGGAIGLLAGDEQDPVRERDLNDRERALAQQRAALVQVISHELRTPLTVIRGGVDTLCAHPEAVAPDYAQLLRATARATRRLEEQLAVVLAASDALGAEQAAGARTADDVRGEVDVAVSGEVPDDAVPVELRELIRDAAASVRGELPSRLVDLLPADAVVVTVEADLWLALRCLLDNAAKFSADGAPIEVAYVRDDAEASISVSDHGGGLPAGFSERAAFAPFTPGDTSLVRSHAGLGMGLYTARQLVRRLGGELELDSSVEGVTASIHLPQPIDGDARMGGGWDRRRLVG